MQFLVLVYCMIKEQKYLLLLLLLYQIENDKTKQLIEMSYHILASSPERNAFTDNIIAAFGRMLRSDFVDGKTKEEV